MWPKTDPENEANVAERKQTDTACTQFYYMPWGAAPHPLPWLSTLAPRRAVSSLPVYARLRGIKYYSVKLFLLESFSLTRKTPPHHTTKSWYRGQIISGLVSFLRVSVFNNQGLKNQTSIHVIRLNNLLSLHTNLHQQSVQPAGRWAQNTICRKMQSVKTNRAYSYFKSRFYTVLPIW